ncbi:hypothetical protein ACOMHN_049211 [Nucella lapillus]
MSGMRDRQTEVLDPPGKRRTVVPTDRCLCLLPPCRLDPQYCTAQQNRGSLECWCVLFLRFAVIRLLRVRMATNVWYRDDSESKLHEHHLTDPPCYLNPKQLFDKTGVKISKVEKYDDEAEQARLRQEGQYNYHDWLDISREKMPDFEERLAKFYREHLHEDEEIRLVTEGSGFFEVRDYQNKWIRLHVQKGDLMQLPAGIYHRLTLDPAETIKMLRMFKDEPHWQAMFRPEGENCPSRISYLGKKPSSEQ